MQKIQKRAFKPGATMSEYAVVAAMVTLVALAGVMALGNSANAILQNFADSLAYRPKAAVALTPIASKPPTPSQPGGANQPIAQVPPPAQANPFPGAQQQVCFQGGWCTAIPDIKSQVLVDTSGSMGSQLTHQFSDIMLQFAKQEAAQPNADSRLVQMITDLANSGHVLGNQEGTAISECPPGEPCTGNQGTLRDALSLVISKQSMFESNLQTVQNYAKDTPGALPPEILDIINLESQQISSIAQAYHTQPEPSVDGSSLQWSFSNPVEITHQDANTICGSGGNANKCVQPPNAKAAK